MAEMNEQTRKVPLSLYLLDAGIIFPSIIYTVVMTSAIGMIGNPLDPLAQAIRQMCSDGLKADDVDEETMRKYLSTRDYPDPDLLIRTGGELRISNFLLWQIAYTELYFSDQLWPDFRHEDFYAAVLDYQGRQRRYGKTEAQVEGKKYLHAI